MGNVQTTKKVNYEDLQLLINKKLSNTVLINTLPMNEQICLIPNTLNAHVEEKFINDNIKNKELNIILYGKNTSDKSVEKKYLKLRDIGFTNLFIYPGGLFEWLCLQDIYGQTDFPSTSKELDILKYKPGPNFTNYLLMN